jgi:hypothetical protein
MIVFRPPMSDLDSVFQFRNGFIHPRDGIFEDSASRFPDRTRDASKTSLALIRSDRCRRVRSPPRSPRVRSDAASPRGGLLDRGGRASSNSFRTASRSANNSFNCPTASYMRSRDQSRMRRISMISA